MPRLITWVILVASSLSATAQSRPAVPPLPEEVAAVEAQEEILRPAELKFDTSAADAVWAEGFVLFAGSDGSVWNKEKFLSDSQHLATTKQGLCQPSWRYSVGRSVSKTKPVSFSSVS